MGEIIKLKKGLLLPAQRRWVEDTSWAMIWEASRQIGKTFAETLKAVIETWQSKRPIESVYGSASARQVYKAGREIRKHLRVLKIATEDIVTTEKDNTELIVFPGGKTLNLVPSNPDTTAGYSGNVYLDEFALHRDDRGIWRAIAPAITRGYKIRICSTHRGKKTKFYELIDNPKYSRHRTTIYDAIAEGLELKDDDGHIMTVEDLKAIIADDEIWAEEYEVEAQDESTAWLTHAMLFAIEEPDIDHEPAWVETLIEKAEEAHRIYKALKRDPDWWEFESRRLTQPLAEIEDPLDLGMDIGRTRDLTVMWLTARKPFAKKTVAVLSLKKKPFYVQKKALWALLPHVMRKGRASIDQHGIGRQLAEESQDRFGSKVEGLDFTNANKEILAVGLKDAIDDHGVLIPKDDTIHTSLHSIKKTLTATGLARFDAERNEQIGHADHFWALALAIHAAGNTKGSIEYESIAKRAFGGMKGTW
jgi:phage FluMu gp28-like protein